MALIIISWLFDFLAIVGTCIALWSIIRSKRTDVSRSITWDGAGKRDEYEIIPQIVESLTGLILIVTASLGKLAFLLFAQDNIFGISPYCYAAFIYCLIALIVICARQLVIKPYWNKYYISKYDSDTN